MSDAIYETEENYSVKPGETGRVVFTGLLLFFDFKPIDNICVL
jgi:hypothetical protein